MGRKFLTVGVTGLWDRIPKGAVGSPALETFRNHLDVFLRDLMEVIPLWQMG